MKADYGNGVCKWCGAVFVKHSARHGLCSQECTRLFKKKKRELKNPNGKWRREPEVGKPKSRPRLSTEEILAYAMERGISYGKAVAELETKPMMRARKN